MKRDTRSLFKMTLRVLTKLQIDKLSSPRVPATLFPLRVCLRSCSIYCSTVHFPMLSMRQFSADQIKRFHVQIDFTKFKLEPKQDHRKCSSQSPKCCVQLWMQELIMPDVGRLHRIFPKKCTSRCTSSCRSNWYPTLKHRDPRSFRYYDLTQSITCSKTIMIHFSNSNLWLMTASSLVV